MLHDTDEDPAGDNVGMGVQASANG